MAAGDGGFSTQVGGFNKNEVNEYIGKISKEKKELEAELREAQEKLKKLENISDEADAKVKQAQEDCEKKIAEANTQVRNERKKSEELILQIDDLKRKLKNGGFKSGSTGDADKRAEEIINAANEKARKIIANAEKTAASMSGGVSTKSVDVNALMTLLKGFQSTVSNELQKLSAKASEVLNTPVANIAVPAPAKSDNSMDGFFSNIDEESSDNDMNGFADMTAAEPAGDITAPASNDMDMEDMNVAPLDDPDIPKNEPNDDFSRDLLAQSVPTSALNDAMQDLLNSASGSSDIKGNDDSVDFDMGGDSADSGMSDIDAMNALLGQMSASLESAGGSAELDNEPAEEPASSSDDNPWASLQAQLDAMEKSGNYGEDSTESEPEGETITDVPQAPSADDANIWNFGSSSSSDDDMSDDMSADLFGSF